MRWRHCLGRGHSRWWRLASWWWMLMLSLVPLVIRMRIHGRVIYSQLSSTNVIFVQVSHSTRCSLGIYYTWSVNYHVVLFLIVHTVIFAKAVSLGSTGLTIEEQSYSKLFRQQSNGVKKLGFAGLPEWLYWTDFLENINKLLLCQFKRNVSHYDPL